MGVDAPAFLVVRREIHGAMDVIKLERVWVICPACVQQLEAVSSDARVKGYCAVAKQSVDFPIEKQRTKETKAEMSVGLSPKREGRDSRGRFIKGNLPQNKGK